MKEFIRHMYFDSKMTNFCPDKGRAGSPIMCK